VPDRRARSFTTNHRHLERLYVMKKIVLIIVAVAMAVTMFYAEAAALDAAARVL
jgi:hypothetical protein